MEYVADRLELIARAAGWIDRLLPPFWKANIGRLLVGAAFVVFARFVIREIATYWSLAPHRRRRYLIRSTGKNRWSRAELELWAAQLSMIRRRVRIFTDRQAQAIRIRLEVTPQGPVYTIEGSRRLERIMLNPALSGVTVTQLRPRASRRFRRRRPHDVSITGPSS